VRQLTLQAIGLGDGKCRVALIDRAGVQAGPRCQARRFGLRFPHQTLGAGKPAGDSAELPPERTVTIKSVYQGFRPLTRPRLRQPVVPGVYTVAVNYRT
jgi:hypothetical protein